MTGGPSAPRVHDELLWLAWTTWMESRGEPEEGQLAVASVVMNRCAARSQDVVSVVLAPLQFSAWNGNALARRLVATIDDSPAWRSCHRAACAAYHGLLPDPTHGANSYCVSTLRPDWYDASRITATIGHHVFFKLP